MSNIVLAAGVQSSRDLPPGATRIPRQEWLGPATASNRSTDDADAGESPTIRLVGHKVLAQGAGRTARTQQAQEVAQTAVPGRDIEPAQVSSDNSGFRNIATAPGGSASYATRAIAVFSQQLGGFAGAKGTLLDTYA